VACIVFILQGFSFIVYSAFLDFGSKQTRNEQENSYQNQMKM